MKYCPNCGTPFEDKALFCGECGFSLAPNGEPAGQAAYGKPADQAPNGQPADQAPNGEPADQAPYGQPADQAPYGQPAGGASYGQPAGQAPYGQPAGGASYGQPAGQAPYGQPAGGPPYGGPEGNASYSQAPYGQGGMPAYEQPGMPAERQGGKKRGKRGGSNLPLIIGIAVLAIAVIGIAVFLITRLAGKKTTEDFVDAQVSFAEERLHLMTDDIAKESFSSDVTISASLDGRGDFADIMNEILEDSAVVFKLNSEKNKMLLNASLLLKGSNILEGFLSVTPDQIGFSVPNVDDTLYVVNMDKLLESMGSDAGNFDLSVNAKQIRADVDEIIARYRGVLSKQITRDRLSIEKKRDVKLTEAGKTVTCTVMVWEPDEDELIELCDALADALETDDRLAEILEPYALAEGYTGGMEILEDAADMLRDEADVIAEEMVGAGFTWTLALDGKGQVALISVVTDNGEMIFERALDGKAGTEAFYLNEGRATLFMMSNTYTIDGSKRAGELVLDTDSGSVSMEYDIDFSKRSVFGIPYGTYTPDLSNLTGGGVAAKLRVEDGGSGSTNHVIEVSGLKNLTDDMVRSFEIVCNTTGKSSVKEPSGKQLDISDYDEDEIGALVDELGAKIADGLMESPEIMELMESLMGY